MASEVSPLDTSAQRAADYERFKNYTAYTFLVAAPVLIALPPRRLDHLTVLLGTAFALSANHVTAQQTGRSVIDRLNARLARPSVLSDLPSERAVEIQARLRAARDAQIQSGGAVGEELEKLKARQVQDQGAAKRIWMGGESDGWMERRLKEEQKALQEGKGYGDLIQEYIWDVWNWGKTESNESEKKD